MDLNIIRIIWYIKLFILLVYFFEKTSCLLCMEKPDLSILKTICVVRDNPKYMDRLPTEPKCTAIGLYGDMVDLSFPVTADFPDINKFRNGLPFVYIYNYLNHYQILDDIKPQIIDKYLKEINEIITEHKISVMIFDNLYMSRDIQNYGQQLDRNADQIRIHNLLRALKIMNQNILFGMMISYEEGYLEGYLDDINLAYYDTVIDFFAFNTMYYRKCLKNKDITTTVDELNKIIIQMESLGFNMRKSIITIELQINDVCDGFECNIRSYENYCSHDNAGLGICDDTLENYYQKGLLVNTHNISGAIIQSITDDDYSNRCCCGPYAGLTVIDAGMRGSPEPKHITHCKKWGQFHTSC